MLWRRGKKKDSKKPKNQKAKSPNADEIFWNNHKHPKKKTKEQTSKSLLYPAILTIWIICSIIVFVLLHNITMVVHGDLYNYGLVFSYNWAGPYSIFLQLNYVVLGLPIAISAIAIFTNLRNRRNIVKKTVLDSKVNTQPQMRPQYQLQYAADPESLVKTSSEDKQIKIKEQYPLNDPHAYAKIVEDPSRGTLSYLVIEPELNENDKIQLNRLEELLIEVLEVNISAIETRELAADYLLKQSIEIMKNHDFKMDKATRDRILYYVVRDHIGFGKIDPLMRDPFIEDISCDGTNLHLYVWHRKYEYIPTNIVFKTIEELNAFASRLAYLCGSHISIAQPMLDASLPEGSRLHLTFGKEITRRGSTFTIRKFKLDPLTIIDLISNNTLSAEVSAYLWYAVENRASILVGGGIASGKTTLLNCLSMFIKPAMKIVTIEDTAELNLPHENWVPSITRSHFGVGTEQSEVTLFDLLKSSLRQRPDHIIVGEVRGAEAYTLFQAISTGHLGMSTLHAESVEAAIYRLESEPMNIPRTLISGIDLILVQKRVEKDGRPYRKTIATTEIVGLDPRSREILTNEVYKWNPITDKFNYTGRSYLLERNAAKNGLSMDKVNREIKRRTRILQWMVKNNIRSYTDVSNIIQRFYEKPKVVYAEARKR